MQIRSRKSINVVVWLGGRISTAPFVLIQELQDLEGMPMELKAITDDASTINEYIFERAWRIAFGLRGDERLAIPLEVPFLEAMRSWHAALEVVDIPPPQRTAYDQQFIAFTVSLCQGTALPCCVAVSAVRSAARRPLSSRTPCSALPAFRCTGDQ